MPAAGAIKVGTASMAVCSSPGASDATPLSGGRLPLVSSSTPSGRLATAAGKMMEQPRIESSGVPSHMPRAVVTVANALPPRYGVS